MLRKTYETELGSIVYFVSELVNETASWLVLLPGLTADHRLFEKQVEHFDGKVNVFVWDLPAQIAP